MSLRPRQVRGEATKKAMSECRVAARDSPPLFLLPASSLSLTLRSVVLHHFAEWAQYPSHTAIEGYKFQVDESRARIDAGLKFKQMEEAAAASAAGGAEAEAEGAEAGDE